MPVEGRKKFYRIVCPDRVQHAGMRALRASGTRCFMCVAARATSQKRAGNARSRALCQPTLPGQNECQARARRAIALDSRARHAGDWQEASGGSVGRSRTGEGGSGWFSGRPRRGWSSSRISMRSGEMKSGNTAAVVKCPCEPQGSKLGVLEPAWCCLPRLPPGQSGQPQSWSASCVPQQHSTIPCTTALTIICDTGMASTRMSASAAEYRCCARSTTIHAYRS